MKLNIVPASQGAQWVKLGIKTFFRQPLALSGLFFIFLAAIMFLKVVPIVGGPLASVLLPGLAFGLLAAAQQAANGKFPMPTILFTAFRIGPVQRRHMLVLGALYTAGSIAVLCSTLLVDGGDFVKAMLLGQAPSDEAVKSTGFRFAMIFALALYMPMLHLFCLAAALAYWYGTPPIKGLFFGLAAVKGNFSAFVIYGLVWMGVTLGFGMIVSALAATIGGTELVAAVAPPAALLVLAAVFTSIYFTFQGSFEFTPGDDT